MRCLSLVLLLTLAPSGNSLAADRPETDARARLALADTLLAHGRYAAVESLATAIRADLERAARPDTLQLAQAWLDVSRARGQQPGHADSTCLNAAERCLSMLEGRHDAPDTMVFLAHRYAGAACTNMGRARLAVTHLRSALTIARRRPEWGPLPLSLALYNLGRALSAVGNGDSARVVFEEALQVRRRLARPHDVLPGKILTELGLIHEQRGEYDKAEQSFEDAVSAIESQVGADNIELAGPLSELAGVETLQGNSARSIDFVQQAMRVYKPFARPDDVNWNILRGILAQSLDRLGDLAQARTIYEEILPHLEAAMGRENPQVLVGRLSLAAACARLGDYARALQLCDEIRDVFSSDSTLDFTQVQAGALETEAEILNHRGSLEAALPLAIEAVRVSEAAGVSYPTLTLQALSVQLRIHGKRREWQDVDRTEARIDSVMRRFEVRGSSESDMAWTARSEVEELRGRHAEAVRAAAEGARTARERLVANVRALSDRQALLLANNTSDPLDQLLKVGARTDPASIHRCWDELARSRGLVRAEITRRRLPPGSERDTVLANAGMTWRLAEQRLAQWEGHMAGALRDLRSDSTLKLLRADVDETERRLARVLPTSTGLVDPGQVGIDSVLAHLKADQALVGLVTVRQTTGRHLLAFVARGDGSPPSSVDLGDLARIEVAVAQWRAELGEPDPALRSESACRRTGAVLRALVWDSIARSTRDARDVYLVPEASLVGVPWGALPVAGGSYLVESGLRIHVLDAERELAAPNVQLAGRGLLAVGGVDFDRATTEAPPLGEAVATNLRGAMTSCGDPVPTRFASLPGTAEEVRDVTLAWSADAASSGPVTSLAREAATEAAFKRLAPGHRVVHLATHGIVLSDTCERAFVGARGVGGVAPVSASSVGHSHGTANVRRTDAATQPAADTPTMPSPWSARETILAFADANHANAHTADENDGLLTAEEVSTLDLRGTDWVVLSACRSAAGDAWEREGVLGMQRAFHVAGARTVIASQWSVDDEATREWMRALYQARSRGASNATEAIALASRSTLEARRRSHRTTHPFYWAAFTASGE